MPKMVITHKVTDVDAWLGHAAARGEAIGALGGTNIVEHVAHDGSGIVAISADVADPDALVAALGSPPPEVAALMESHGVIPPLTSFVQR